MSTSAELSVETHETIQQSSVQFVDKEVKFTTDSGKVVRIQLRPPRHGDPTVWRRMTGGVDQILDIYHTKAVWIDGVSKQFAAVAHSENAGELIFLTRRFNKLLNAFSYSRVEVKPLRILEVSVVQ